MVGRSTRSLDVMQRPENEHAIGERKFGRLARFAIVAYTITLVIGSGIAAVLAIAVGAITANVALAITGGIGGMFALLASRFVSGASGN